MEALTFLRPALLLGLLGLLLPLLIHLLGRRRVPERSIATLEFLRRAAARAQARWRLRRILLLLSRMALLAALTLLFSGPGCEHADDSGGTGIQWVLILDNSPSMAARRQGASAFEQARDALLAMVRSAGPKDRFSFATTLDIDDGNGEPGFPSNREEVTEHLRGAEIRHGLHNVSHALERALGLVEGSPAARIVLATDLQKSAWRRRKLQNDRQVPVVLIDVGTDRPQNAWIRSVTRRDDRILVQVSGGGPDTAIRMSSGEGSVTGFPDGDKFSFRLPSPIGDAVLRFTVAPGGDLKTDDTTGFVYREDDAARVLLVNGAPHGFELRDELLFVRHALTSSDPARESVKTREFRPGDLTAGIPEPLDLVLLANVGALPPDTATALLSRVRSGLTLLMTGGDQWKPLISLESPPGPHTRSLEPFFVASLRDEVTLERGNPLRPPFQRIDRTSLKPPLRIFEQAENGDLSGVRVWKYWLLNASPGAGIRVLLRLDDGTPLLYERPEGAGRLMLLATTVDRDGSDLCLQPAFIPFLERIILYAAGRLETRPPGFAVAGQPLDFVFPSDAVLTLPDETRRNAAAESSGFVPPIPGLYETLFPDGRKDLFWARLAPTESDLTRLDAAELERILGAGRYRVGSGASAETLMGSLGRRDLSPWAAALLLAALAAEALLSARWTRRKAPKFLSELLEKR